MTDIAPLEEGCRGFCHGILATLEGDAYSS